MVEIEVQMEFCGESSQGRLAELISRILSLILVTSRPTHLLWLIHGQSLWAQQTEHVIGSPIMFCSAGQSAIE